MATSAFKRRKRALQQRIQGNGGFVSINVAVEYARQMQEEEQEKKEAERRREDEMKKLNELSLESSDLEFLRINIDLALNQKTINDILKYKKGAENTLKGKARYLGTARSSMYRKKLPTAEQNGGSTLDMYHFVVTKTDDESLKRKRNDLEQDGSMTSGSIATTTDQTSTLSDQLTAELHVDDSENVVVDELAILDYEVEEELEDVSVATKFKEDIEEMEALIPVLEEKYNCMAVSDDDQQQTDRASFDLRKYNTFRYASLISYFKKRCFDKKKKVAASREVAKLLWSNNNSAYYSMKIRSWAAIFVRFRALPNYKKGLHSKTFCYLNVKEVALETKKKIMETQASFRTLVYLCNHVNSFVIPQIFEGAEGRINPSTLAKYMRSWGFRIKNLCKTIYYDGHEREDVVAYRNQWSSRMMDRKPFMDAFLRDEKVTWVENVVIPSNQRLVHVTHDECTYFANEGKSKLWLLDGTEEPPLLPKGTGASIMVSEFQCPCHGTMVSPSDPSKTSRELFFAGKGRDGWWTAGDMNRQFKLVVEIFEELHPNQKGVFLFDNSSNHQAYSADALLARNMTFKDKKIRYKLDDNNSVIQKEGDRWYPFRNGKLPNGQEQTICTYTIINETRKEYHVHVKGVATILKERKLWFTKNPFTGAKINLRCDAKDGEIVKYLDGSANQHCCHYHILHRQPDFQMQRPSLEESVIASGHIFDLYPKFHCETNWIERYWGAAKWRARRECDYTFESLKQNLDSFLDGVGVVKIRRFHNRCWRYIEAYARCCSGKEAEAIVKQFSKLEKSHRRNIGRGSDSDMSDDGVPEK